ncbi:MAG: M23 family metallopeptidase [Caulobacteraceae bacterium]
MSAQALSTTTRNRRRDWSPALMLLALVGASLGLALEAAAASRVLPYREISPAAAATTALQPLLGRPGPEKLVWRGVDVDGDGQPDFASPTGLPVRACDAYGCGGFGARRDAGERDHEGVDFDAVAGQAVHAPVSGFVTKVGMAYPDDAVLKFVEITNPALRYVTRVFYIDPMVVEGQAVRLGEEIGEAHSLERRYPGITNHVHLEVAREGHPRIDATRLIVARLEPSPPANTALAQDAGATGRTS